LEEVISNLIHNAIEAMDATTDRGRVLRVKTGLKAHDAITIGVQDSGIDSIFGAFFTTKSHEMGLGLAICRMIVEDHGGQLTAVSDAKNGALFQLALPIESIEKGTARAKKATSTSAQWF
jgi:C4-dicarboxylate-specific signal transduction histidine kinase